MQDPSIRAAIAALGTALGPAVLAQCMALFRDELSAPAEATTHRVLRDVAYGAHVRQRLDLYRHDTEAATRAPVFVWVHGGGFVRGEKHSPEHPFNAHVGYWAARQGWLGAVMNYRLAPEHRWPSGGEDVGAVVDWLRAQAAQHGGDPQRIVLAGTSAGSVHIATCLQRRGADLPVRGAVLLSGLYGATALEGQDAAYYGDASLRPEQVVLEAVATSRLPLLVACAEFDPARFQAETLALLQRVLVARDRAPRSHFASGHNHYTLAMHLGTADTRLADEIVSFVHDVT
jgi:triacylglycerol lipase